MLITKIIIHSQIGLDIYIYIYIYIYMGGAHSVMDTATRIRIL